MFLRLPGRVSGANEIRDTVSFFLAGNLPEPTIHHHHNEFELSRTHVVRRDVNACGVQHGTVGGVQRERQRIPRSLIAMLPFPGVRRCRVRRLQRKDRLHQVPAHSRPEGSARYAVGNIARFQVAPPNNDVAELERVPPAVTQ